jgi:DNA-binding response OmpR family regulator
VYAVSASDDLSPPIEPLRVTVVTVATTATTQAVVHELRRELMQVELALLDLLDGPPTAPVYVVSLEPAMRATLAPRFVAWAAASELHPGLIGLVESGSTHDSEELLAAGFDDVVTTPVSARELVARVRAVHRRVHWKGTSNGRLRFGDLTLDLYGRELWVDGTTISLTSIELAVLRELMKARGKPLSRADLLDLAWGEADLEVSERAVDNVILRLRRKLSRPDLIETVRSVGFRLTAVSRSGQ